VVSASKSVLITGCSSGIGAATAAKLHAEGWKVWATARNVDSLEDLRAQGCEVLALDVTSEESMVAAVNAVVEADGAVGVLINNAGYSQSGAVEDVPLDRVRKQFETNVFGALRMCQLCLPGMRDQRWGRIVNISSMGGTLTFPGGGVYHASKHAMEALSDAMRWEVAGFGVKVIVVQPGLIRTNFSNAVEKECEVGEGPYAEFNAQVVKGTHEFYNDGLMAKLAGDPIDVANVVSRSIHADWPWARYPVTASAYFLMAVRRWLPDGGWDRFVSGSFPRPGT